MERSIAALLASTPWQRPAGRAIVFSSGSRATLVQAIPWMDRPYADQIRASLMRFDPGNRRTAAGAQPTAPGDPTPGEPT
ncbi:hypothetical protein [Kribbella sp. C-35]|uniref:hypothetical protein n=1 Tax=Kribbella sp. C-35 TaxID=2789276 RepID=UPI00397AC19C